MAERLSPLDLSLLYAEGPTTPLHGGGLAIFDEPPGGIDFDSFADFISSTIAAAPRYRQKLKSVPGRLAGPVWVSDAHFDLSYHLRRAALPRPGSADQLRDFLARVQSRPLDRHRPLWELYLLEGLADGRYAIVTKTHHAIVDGRTGVDIVQLILDTGPPRRADLDRADLGVADLDRADLGVADLDRADLDVADLDGAGLHGTRTDWAPAAVSSSSPGAIELVAQALADGVRSPRAVLDLAKLRSERARAIPKQAMIAAAGLLGAAWTAVGTAPGSPLNAKIGAQRRFATADTALESYRMIRRLRGGTVNDAVLTVVTGAIRGWMLSRGEAVTPATVVRALVPVSVRGPDEADFAPSRVVSYLVDLPVGEPNSAVALTQISYAMRAHVEGAHSVGAGALAALSGFAPPTLHALGARAASSFTSRLFNVVISNVPGSQHPLSANGCLMRECYPVVPLAMGQALAIGLTSYNGRVFYGLNADRDAMSDVEVIAGLLPESLAELVGNAETASVSGR